MTTKPNGDARMSPCGLSAIIGELTDKLGALDCLEFADRVEAINQVRSFIHEMSPFKTEPVDLVLWVPNETVRANSWNPNSVAAPERELLRLSISADGYTQPIVTFMEEDGREVVDGFHRNLVGKECPDIRERVHGYLPVVQIRAEQTDKSDRMAATIRHNRARGKHRVDGMSDIVLELKRRNWSDEKIGKQLGMDPDEVLRLTQISGLSIMFADREFSQAWEHSGQIDPDDGTIDAVDLEWMNGMKQDLKSGWNDQTDRNSVLIDLNGQRLGAIQKSRFDETWHWYAYAAPMRNGAAVTLEQAKSIIETEMGAVPSGEE